MKHPTIPVTVPAPGGVITVKIVDKLEDGGVGCWGLWVADEREVRIEKHRSRAHMWRILYHELTHAALADSGLDNLLTDQQQEAICEAVATARMRERFG
jgi:hypothetical protein